MGRTSGQSNWTPSSPTRKTGVSTICSRPRISKQPNKEGNVHQQSRISKWLNKENIAHSQRNYGSQQLQPIDQSSSQVQPPIDHADYSMAAQEDSISSNNTFCHQQFSLFHSLEFILDHRTSARDINNFRSRQFRLSHRLDFTLT